MKRKVKLFATIACLCLSLALMAFGVYAASTSTITVSSKVSFEAKDVYVDYEVKIFVGASGEAIDPSTASAFDTKTASSYQTVGTVKNPVADPQEETLTLAAAELNTTNRGCKIVIKVTNAGTDDVKITVTDSTMEANTNFTFSTASDTGTNALECNDEYTYVRYADITDITTDAELTWNIVVKVEKA